jgi:hypothetical protein
MAKGNTTGRILHAEYLNMTRRLKKEKFSGFGNIAITDGTN